MGSPGLDRIDAPELRAVLTTFGEALRDHKDALNRLNVYPVPDGDTGTNMALTVESVVEALAVDPDADLAATCQAMSHGSLMGARGNSGVILSQILRGLAEVVGPGQGMDGPQFAEAMVAAADAAYEAVMRPVEGTILTVVREASEAAKAAAADGDPLVAVVDAARRQGGDALERTPDLLPVLAEAGVVDAGGAGLLLLLDAALHVIDGRPLPDPPEDIAVGADPSERVDAGAPDDVSDLRYEVMYFLEAPDETVPAFKDVWAGIGDSIVVVGGDGIWNCHIHTDDIGAAVEAALDAGRPRDIRVTDLLEQVEEERWVRDAVESPVPDPPIDPVPTAVVAVGTGEGIHRIFHALGVQSIVAGGQSMNPSTAQLLEAVDSVAAEEVVILPNNKNIIPVAEQVDGESAKNVVVVPTRGVAEGFASLLAYDPHATGAANRATMAEAASAVVAGEITQAVRDSTSDVGSIREGEFLGIGRAGIQVVAPTLAEAGVALLNLLVTDDHEIVTIIEGDGASAAATRDLTEWLGQHRPDAAAEVHHGGQPLYPYLFGIE